jgi:hypothetical protein
VRSPLYCQNLLDSCALSPGPDNEADAGSRIIELYKNQEKMKFTLIVSHTVRAEVFHPNTPDWVKKLANEFVYTLPTNLTPEELAHQEVIWKTVTGNGKPENYKQDAEHLFQAAKYGGGYFITVDHGILGKGALIQKLTGVQSILPSAFLPILQSALASS